MLRFEHPYYFYLFALVPLLLVLYILMLRWKKKALQRYGDTEVVKLLMPDYSKKRLFYKFLLLLFSFASLVLALANPQIGSRIEKVERKGIDIMIALDVSNSMLSEDIQPNRIERAKQAVSRLIDNLTNDRIGMVVFAGKAYTQMPITTDYAAARLFLDGINPGMVPTQGTAIGEAIDQCMNSFGESKKSKAIIIVTDGENHQDDAVAKAKEAYDKDIRVYTVGMGSPDGAPIPMIINGRAVGYKKDKDGNTIITKMNPVALGEIANAGNGVYISGNNTNSLKDVLNNIDKLEKSSIDSRVFSDYEDRFQYFLALALLLLICEIFIFERKARWADRIKLFD
ncbi:MAG: VWA domain-containing protein [Bacteroidetes bacterium]|nr:VWA domain-containing protein [Bacteroidota bacterium]